ncbi:MAG: flagellar basal body-associated FliL family protein [Sedimentisphaerales bacterium]|nr:flagellar basal body-associated FliL family protein [Sedimentisphaerales bacterium]
MADAEDKKEQEAQVVQEGQEKQKNPEAEKSGIKSLIARFLPWIIMVVVVLVCAGAGFSVGRLFAGPGTPQADVSGSEADAQSQTHNLKTDNDSADDFGNVWYYDLDPVVANLNEPAVTRYVRASLTLEMSADVDVKKGTALLEMKKPILINWLTVYLSSLSLEDIRGDKNLRSIQSHIRDAFNEKLFPDSKSQIKQVLIKEFPVQ